MYTLHVVSHTHWDREWYQTFQQFRFRLVEVIDGLLALLDNDPDYRHFTLDGQTIVLDDYLEIRPEAEARIRRLVQSGRLLIGPWYILPDEFLEGPEAMVRNLLMGRQGCRRFSARSQPMEGIGYIPDSFGHIGQMPQIAAGFGMQALCVWRGVPDAPTELRWASPDGTERLLIHLRESYSNGAWLGAGPEAFARDLGAARDALAPHATTRNLLILQGTDHMPPREDTAACLRLAEERLGDRCRHSTLPDYVASVQTELGESGFEALPVHRGELRSSQRFHLLPGILSARMHLKQQNARCEALLTRWAEPFSAMAQVLSSAPSQRGFLGAAWALLLQNHPHDSICGCSIDQVDREMQSRFDQAEQLAEQVTEAGLNAIARHVGRPKRANGSPSTPRIVAFNPSAEVRSDRVRVRVPARAEGAWGVYDVGGARAPCRVVAHHRREHMNERMSRERFLELAARVTTDAEPSEGPWSYRITAAQRTGDTAHLELLAHTHYTALLPGTRADAAGQLQALLADEQVRTFHLHAVEEESTELEFLACGVPGTGYAQFLLVQSVMDDAPAPARTSIENEYYRVEADPDSGTLTIFDLETGLVLRGVNRFSDGGDRGDEYTFCPPEANALVDLPAAAPVIRRCDDGLGQGLDIGLLFRIPHALADGDRSRRSSECVDLPISIRVLLTPGVRRVEFETRVVNTARDHRLRVLFPTPISTDRSRAEGHYDVVERPVALPASDESCAEAPVGTHPQLAYVDLSDGGRGVLLANLGLPEYEALPAGINEEGVTLALTLLRCVGWLSRGDLHVRKGQAGPALETPGAQCLGEHVFRYALVTHAGNYLEAQGEAHAFEAPFRAVCVDTDGGALPESAAFVALSPGAVVLDAIKSPEEGTGLIVRVHNSAAVPVEARLQLWQPYCEASLVRMDEAVQLERLSPGGTELAWTLRAKEIATLRLDFGLQHPV